jgi:hypothetical protein
VIIAMDGGNDPESDFYDFLRMLRRNAADCGIRLIGLEPDDQPHLLNRLCSTPPANFCKAHYVVIRIQYPDSPSLGPAGSVQDGYLIYVKSSLTGDEGLSLLKYREENAAFPHDTTLDQFYDAQRFEAYRQLGLHIGVKLCSELDAENADQKRAWLAAWNPRQRGSAPLPASDASQSTFVDTAAMALVSRNSEVALVSTDSAPQGTGGETMDGAWDRPKKGK